MKLDKQNIINQINSSSSLEELELVHKNVFSKSGILNSLMKNFTNLSIDEKKAQGKLINQIKSELQDIFHNKSAEIKQKLLEERIQKEFVDLTLPVGEIPSGGLHPITQVTKQIISIFSIMGFSVVTEREIEEDFYNFTSLNIPAHHPARQEHDTFYLNSKDEKGNSKVLRTHTSNTQIRAMQLMGADLDKKPIRFISPGRTYRSDSDATHSPMFHQVEGIYVDKKEKISVSLLKSVLSVFADRFFSINNLDLRFRPSYFPFTSPSYEIDVKCDRSKDQLIIGKGNEWLEILGSGIVHPNVLENCNIDSKVYSGIAFGMGIERLTMLKYGFKDLRSMFASNVRWLEYYNFSPNKNPSIFEGLD